MSDATEQLVDELTVEEPAKKKISGKLIVIIGVVLLLAIGGGVYFFLMQSGGEKDDAHAEDAAHAEYGEHDDHGKDGHYEGDKKEEKVELPTGLVFYELPELLVNLKAAGRANSYLKAKVALELADGTTRADLEEKLPRVTDEFLVYLRELRVEDLTGSAGVYRLKEELLVRVNQAIAPARISDVLFKEMLVQ